MLTIWILDQEKIYRESLRRYLLKQRPDYAIKLWEDPEKVVAAWQTDPPDLLIYTPGQWTEPLTVQAPLRVLRLLLPASGLQVQPRGKVPAEPSAAAVSELALPRLSSAASILAAIDQYGSNQTLAQGQTEQLTTYLVLYPVVPPLHCPPLKATVARQQQAGKQILYLNLAPSFVRFPLGCTEERAEAQANQFSLSKLLLRLTETGPGNPDLWPYLTYCHSGGLAFPRFLRADDVYGLTPRLLFNLYQAIVQMIKQQSEPFCLVIQFGALSLQLPARLLPFADELITVADEAYCAVDDWKDELNEFLKAKPDHCSFAEYISGETAYA
ncbi:response regulator [Oscillospiraceae bacterium HV4-5-C5C]|nr:response regulator [Oscillospiraceae bacterium HV4-5-C5C]